MCAQVLERVGVQGHGMATALSACIPASKVRRSAPEVPDFFFQHTVQKSALKKQ